jgi:hypothetical protein
MKLLAATITAVVLVRAAPASACGPAGSYPSPDVAPGSGQSVPENIPAVVTRPARDCTIEFLELIGPGGEPLATTGSSSDFGLRMLRQRLVAGRSYLLRFDHECSTNYVAAPVRKEITFSAAPSRPFPSSTGRLRIVEAEVGSVTTSQYSCVGSVLAGYVRLELSPDPELVPFLPNPPGLLLRERG